MALAVKADGLAGIELLEVEYGINDRVKVRGYTGDIHHCRVYESIRKGSYFILYKRRQYLNDFIVVW